MLDEQPNDNEATHPSVAPSDGNDQLEEGGDVSSASDFGVNAGPPRDPEQSRSNLALLLVGLLAVTILGHYIAISILEWNGKKSDALTSAYHEALPVISGLVSSAVTYYFTRELKK